VPYASGNIATCDALGFLISSAFGASLCYNFSICFYYLAIITYDKKDDYIRRKLEPWFHGFSILYPLLAGFIFLSTDAFNGSNAGPCFMEVYAPPHCIGYQAGDIPKGYSIPCGRGGGEVDHAKIRTTLLVTSYLTALVIAPAVILGTMLSMYRSVCKVEKLMQNYGVSALRLRTTPAPAADQQEERGFAIKMRKFGKYLCCRYEDAGTRSSRATKSNKMRSQKRAVLHMAFGYAVAWLVVWLPYLVVIFSNPPDALVILSQVMQPLQGFLNFFVYMAPKVRISMRMMVLREKNRSSIQQNQHFTWRQVFVKAYMSRGAKNTRHRNYTKRERNSS
jgi:hypothetical protein